MDITTTTHDQLLTRIVRAYSTKIPLFIHGTMGIGKSYMVRKAGQQVATSLDLKYTDNPDNINKEDTFLVQVIPLHQYEPSEIKGLPTFNKDRTATIYLQNGLLPTSGQGILFFDELPNATPLVQTNTYNLILERRLGQYKLPEGYLALGAGNLADDKGYIHEMALPLKNRWKHTMLLVPTGDSWINEFALPNNIDHRIINFIALREDRLYTYDPEADEEFFAYATPRTWEFASNSIRDLEDDQLDLLQMEIGDCVGRSIANEFIAYMRLSQKHNIAKIIDSGILPDNLKPMETYAIMSAAVSFYSKEQNQTEDIAEKMLCFIQKFNPEYIVLLLTQIKNTDSDAEDGFIAKVKRRCPNVWEKFCEDIAGYLI